MPKQILETINYKNSIADRMFAIENNESLDHEERRIAMCEVLLELIKDKKGKELEPHLSEVSINTNDGALVISLKFPPD
ncbi:MAG: hypothetical protein MR704_06925, partial [Clostridia bacterium]|nr:hypothetical protein [Clostridia bacterium]